MTQDELKNLSLKTKVYHPFFGEGTPVKLTENGLDVDFKRGGQATFKTSGILCTDRFIEELFLNPVKIVKAE